MTQRKSPSGRRHSAPADILRAVRGALGIGQDEMAARLTDALPPGVEPISRGNLSHWESRSRRRSPSCREHMQAIEQVAGVSPDLWQAGAEDFAPEEVAALIVAAVRRIKRQWVR